MEATELEFADVASGVDDAPAVYVPDGTTKLYADSKAEPPKPFENLNWIESPIHAHIKEQISKMKFISLHEQVYRVFETMKEVIPNGEPVKWVFKLFNFKSLNAVRYHVKCHEKAVETFKTVGAAPKSRKSGRPTLISEVQLHQISSLVNEAYAKKELLTFTMIQRFISEKMNLVASFDTVRRILHDRDVMKFVPAQPVEPGDSTFLAKTSSNISKKSKG